jgi:hypothetical protein
VLAVREHLRLKRQEGTTGVHEIETRQAVLARDLLCAQVLLDGEGVVRATFHRRVVRDDDALSTFDDADTRDDSRRRGVAVVELPGG